jgi:hypothetical protein
MAAAVMSEMMSLRMVSSSGSAVRDSRRFLHGPFLACVKPGLDPRSVRGRWIVVPQRTQTTAAGAFVPSRILVRETPAD